MSDQETIYALSTAPGRAGVAIIRISGPGVERTLNEIAGTTPRPRQASLRTLTHPITREHLDHALVISFPAPSSFTGEHVCEFHIHGGKAVIESVLEALSCCQGLRLAEPGEFSRRAFLNGKMDLTQIEGLADLINAQTESQRRQALQQSTGALGILYESWRNTIITGLAYIEAELDFSDEEDVPQSVASQAYQQIKESNKSIKEHLQDNHRGEIMRDGFRIVIAGPPNAGKSTLLNVLSQRQAAIVSEEAGTTRDAIEVHLNLNGYAVIITDTAGIREAHNKIEQEGIRRAQSYISNANLVLWCEDIAQVSNSTNNAPSFVKELEHILNQDSESIAQSKPVTCLVLNKVDQFSSEDIKTVQQNLQKRDPEDIVENALLISAKTGFGVNHLIDHISQHVQTTLGTQDALLITRARHREHLEICKESLKSFLNAQELPLELQVEHLRIAANAIGRITGRIDVEDILGEIFSSFCIGK
ncbi:MAG: tRNA uridine-5-carboxymethylaminomethyl(34) synthesis GTPase MnmE [Pseudomonadota bacterium]